MRSTILPPDGFDPTALGEPGLRVEVRPGRGINTVLVEVRHAAGTSAFPMHRANPGAPWRRGLQGGQVPSQGPSTAISDRIDAAVDAFVAANPDIFAGRWKLQAFVAVKSLRAEQRAAWLDVVGEVASFEAAKDDPSEPWEGLHYIGSRDVWQDWTLPDEGERADWERTGVRAIGLEFADPWYVDDPDTAYMLAVRDPALARGLRDAHVKDLPGDDILYEYRPHEDAVALVTRGGPLTPSGDLQATLLRHAARCASAFGSAYPDVFSDVARDSFGECRYTSGWVSAHAGRAQRPAQHKIETLAASVGLSPEELEGETYTVSPLPAEIPGDLPALARALDAAGAHRFAQVVMDKAADPDAAETLLWELSTMQEHAADLPKAPCHRMRDVPSPEGEEAIIAFAEASVEACRAASERRPGM